jgi:hypothetical protein
MKLRKLAVLVLCMGSLSAHADVVQMDWLSAGDNKGFLDERTGLEWLDLNVTEAMSVDTVLAQTGVGGTYEGWRMADKAEVYSLFDTLAASSLYRLGPTSTAATVANSGSSSAWSRTIAMVYVMGYTHTQNNLTKTAGVFQNPDSNGGYSVGQVYTSRGTSSYNSYLYWDQYTNLFDDGSWSSATALGDIGIYLVSDGGTTLSSQSDPTLNSNNPNAPINDVSVMAPAYFSFGFLALAGGLLRRKIAAKCPCSINAE